MFTKELHTIPNFITLGRLLFFPAFLVTLLLDLPIMYLFLFVFHALLDVIDGIAARTLKQTTELGRRLDTIVDYIVLLPSYAIGILFVIREIEGISVLYVIAIVAPVVIHLLMHYFAYKYTNKFGALHLVSGKFSSVMVTVLIGVTILFSFLPVLFYITCLCSLLYNLEALLIYITKKEKINEEILTIFKDQYE